MASHPPRMVLYSPDGNGRDTYINYNNGGFWEKGKLYNHKDQHIKVTANRYHYKFIPKHIAPPFKYNSDGSGRDSYVIWESGGLKKDHKPLNQYHLKDFLRNAEISRGKPAKLLDSQGRVITTRYLSKFEMSQNYELKKLEKGLVDRLYIKEKHKFIKDNK